MKTRLINECFVEVILGYTLLPKRLTKISARAKVQHAINLLLIDTVNVVMGTNNRSSGRLVLITCNTTNVWQKWSEFTTLIWRIIMQTACIVSL